MASLTGNKIKDTYTSLLKVGDNGAIDGSAQALSDGAGNTVGLTLTNAGVLVSTTKGTLIGTSSTGEIASGLIADNAIDATRFNISGNGTSGQLIQSDGDGSFSYVAASSGDITGVTAGTGLSGGGTSGAVTLSLTAHTGDVTGTTALTIANNAVSYAKLGVEYTETVALGSGVAVNWDLGSTFTKTLSADATLSFSNAKTGMQINLVISGNYSLTLPSSVKEITANYAGADGEQLISIVSTNGNTEQFATINKVV